MTRNNRFSTVARGLVALLVLALGFSLLIGGGILLYHGGSPYYLLAGLALLVVGGLHLSGRPGGLALFVVFFAVTLAWSLWEVGFNGWQLVPRLGVLALLGVLLLATALWSAPRRFRRSRLLGGVATLVGALGLGSLLHMIHPAVDTGPIDRTGIAKDYPAPSDLGPNIANNEWSAFGNDQGGTRFSPVDQVTADNVSKLEVAWEADVGPASPGPEIGLEVSPIMIGDTLYACSSNNRVFAFDAETGEERWHTDISQGVDASGKSCRGVAYYRVPEATGSCSERIYAPSQTPTLVALDARTGEMCEGFGDEGAIDLRDNIQPYPHGLYYVSSAPQVIRGNIVVGSGIPDGQYWGGPSGVVRAFDAVTGELNWAFDPNEPERMGAPQEGEVYTPSSPNAWAPISADESLGLVYLPVGNATPDNYGGQRRPGDEWVASSVMALDAETGRLRWRFQTTHHDIWDYDVPAQPTLVDLPVDGEMRQALIQPTKRGEVFILDRVTGEPIFPVEEQPVPQGGIVEGEWLSPTQPASIGIPAFRRPVLEERDMWGISPVDQMLCRIDYRTSRYEGHLTPLQLDTPVLIDPGSSGGVNWGGVSLDLDHGVMFVNWMRLTDRVELVTREEAIKRNFEIAEGNSAGGAAQRPMLDTPYGAYGVPFLSPLGAPCNAPPWGAVSAVDLASGKLLWSRPLGSARDTGPMGMASGIPLTIGTPMTGGSMTTAGGLVFIGATAEQTFRALDARTGETLWSSRLPGGGNATPVTYVGPKSGRQFVVIAAGGRQSLKTELSTKIVAFALPEDATSH
ncbi:quinoprotein glucose dehydrogenase [Kushneria avicenniae]|uniref:Quinoprotein glucose dehydrogenase n=1 Tax=Kushneria avicenniae TaxID=402385 RepID=A0A1I1N2B4_9GAMM|nr:pyrroloquinoline quinone-dependent dehydrogenase [Kushneria avicenniae]SFC91781.1 quinoprotein glucose dehydrogenase [Kushneria avicenniae]